MLRLLIVPLLIASTIQVQFKPDKNRPVYNGFFGDQDKIEWCEKDSVWINRNIFWDNWMVQSPPDVYKKLTAPRRIPVHDSIVVTFRKDFYRRTETHAALGAVMVYQTKRNQQRLVLINADKTPDYTDQYRIWPHLGLLYVGTAAYEEGWDVVLWDELIQGHAKLDELVQPGDIVGLSLVVSGIERGVDLAREAKQLGAKYVIAGNDAAIFRANQILDLPDTPIDAVFTSNSTNSVRQFFHEIAQRELCELDINEVATSTRPATQHSNESVTLSYEMQQRKVDRPDPMDGFIVPKLDLYSDAHWNTVWNTYRSAYGHKHTNPESVRGALIHLAQGCTRTQGKKACTYCTIYGVADVRIPSEEYLTRLLERYEAHGINNLYNATDSAYEMFPLVKRLQNIGFHTDSLEIYGRALGIATYPQLLEAWLSFVDDRLLINCGMDSGDEQMLQQGIVKTPRKKGLRISENHQAILNLRGSGAHLLYSLIFGSPGETRESCNRTMEFISWSQGILGQQLDIVETDIYWVNYGSAASRVFHDYGYAKQLATIAGKSITREEWHQDFAQHVDALCVPWSAQEAWYHRFTQIDVATAYEYNNLAKQLMEQHPGRIKARDYAFKPPPEVS